MKHYQMYIDGEWCDAADGAKLESLQTLRGVADYLLGGVIHFVNTHPDTRHAGLILDVQVLLPIIEPADQWEHTDDEEGDGR